MFLELLGFYTLFFHPPLLLKLCIALSKFAIQAYIKIILCFYAAIFFELV